MVRRLSAASILSVDPPIIYVRPRPVPFDLAGLLARCNQGRPFVCIVQTMWTLEVQHHLIELAFVYHRFAEQNPQVRIIIAANTELELSLLREQGVEAVLANHNIFVDDRIFRPLPEVPAVHHAVYNASFSAFKRRELCAELKSCIHIGYAADPRHKDDPVTPFLTAKAALPHHRFLNAVGAGRVHRLKAIDVNRALATADVGLCLSEAEGAMIASMEYLMAGLPVVSTPSRGGRDRYFTALTAITAEPNPRAIREAVTAMRTRAIPRHVVRTATMKLVNRDRAAFNALVDELRTGHQPITGDPRWSFIYANNLCEWRPVKEFALALGLATPEHTPPSVGRWYSEDPAV